MNLNSIMIGSEDAGRLAEYYTKLFGKPAMEEGGFSSWQIGDGGVSVFPHDQVKGKNTTPGRLMWNIESADVQADFDRLKAAGATVVKEPYRPMEAAEMEATEMLVCTFEDPDGNYFQLVSPMGPAAE
jgi:predicted enzyme related to lactoylglutathione lyase